MTASEPGQPFAPEEKGAPVRLEAGTLRLGSTSSNLITEQDLERMDSVMSNAGICRANPAPACKEENLATALYRETGPIVPEIQGQVREGGYAHAAQEEVKSSVLSIANCQTTCFQERGEKLFPQIGQKHR